MLRLTQSYIQDAPEYRAGDGVGEPNQNKFDESQRPEVAGSRRPENADGHSDLAGYSHRIDLTADPAGGPSEVMCIRLLRWAGREAPELLEGLVIAYMTANRRKLLMACGDTAGTTDFERRARLRPGARNGRAQAGKLDELEKRHIAQVLSESGTLREAAARLGINQTTLWRKRKRYSL
jgi:hypothetical protein